MIAISFLGLFMSAALLGSGSAYPHNSTETLLPTSADNLISTDSSNHVWISATSLDATSESSIPDSFATTETPITLTAPITTVAPVKSIDWEAFFQKVKEEDAKLPSNEEMFRSIKKTLETINPDFIPYRALHQTWGLKGMSPEEYEKNVFLPYFGAQNHGQYTSENLPRGMKYRLVVLKEHVSEDEIMLMTPRDYARLCDQPENHDWANCNYFMHICEKVCHFKIWYPNYRFDPEKLTKTIVFDELRESLIHNYLRNQVPTKRSPTYVDPAYNQYVDDGMGGEDVQILNR